MDASKSTGTPGPSAVQQHSVATDDSDSDMTRTGRPPLRLTSSGDDGQPYDAIRPLPETEDAGEPSVPATTLIRTGSQPLEAARSRASSVDKNHRLLVVANRLPLSFEREEKTGKFKSRMSSGGLVSALTGLKGFNMIWIGWPGSEIAEADQPALIEECKAWNCIPVFLPDSMCSCSTACMVLNASVIIPLSDNLTRFSHVFAELANLYYNGFANSTLVRFLFFSSLSSVTQPALAQHDMCCTSLHTAQWPLFHYITVPIEDVVATVEEQWHAYIEANRIFTQTVLSVYDDGTVSR